MLTTCFRSSLGGSLKAKATSREGERYSAQALPWLGFPRVGGGTGNTLLRGGYPKKDRLAVGGESSPLAGAGVASGGLWGHPGPCVPAVFKEVLGKGPSKS